MFNTMTKITVSVIGALVFFVLAYLAAGMLYTTGSSGHSPSFIIAEIEVEEAHAEETQAEEAPAEEAHTDEAPAEEAPAEEAAPVAVADGAGDLAAGEKVFKKCKACHKLEEGAKAVGPDLFAVVGRDVAGREGFKYSDAMIAFGGTWDVERLDTYLADPKGVVPGTKMSFKGLSTEADRANVIAYLESISG